MAARTLLAALLQLFLLTKALAQPIFGSTVSLEWMAAVSSIIVRGQIVSVQTFDGNYKGQWNTVTFRTEETLKGPRQTEFKFIVESVGKVDQDALARYAKGHGQLLLFLVESKRAKWDADILERYPYAPLSGTCRESVIELDSRAGVQALSMALESLSDPADILARTRAAIQAAPKPDGLRAMGIELGRGSKGVPWYLRGYSGITLSVPVDARLEKMARTWIQSPNARVRVRGVKALAPFKSPENIALVKALLDDPSRASWELKPEPSVKLQVREVREAAKDVLDEWDSTWEKVSPASVAASKEMVRIPAGSFTMGSKSAESAEPERKVTLGEYWIGKTAVTVAQFRAFCKASDYKYDWVKNRPGFGYKNDHPMVNVTWVEARAFCKWAGGDLPTEAQWEKAARGTDRRRFPWGNKWDISKLHCLQNTYTGWHATAPVGTYPQGASPYGCLDMAGNVFHWCLGGKTIPDVSTMRNGKAHGTLQVRAVRGSSWFENDTRFAECAGRGFLMPDERSDAIGFRVAASRRLTLP